MADSFPNLGALLGRGGVVAGAGSGTFDITVDFTQEAKAKFDAINRTYDDLQDWREIWDTVVDIIQKGIQENLSFGVTPDGESWAPLSPAYAMKVGRTRMYIPQTSPIWDSYVLHPKLYMTRESLIYTPSGIPEIYQLALRGGWRTPKGTEVPGREWFGLSDRISREINMTMKNYMDMKLKNGISGFTGTPT
jgi:hypothetical protein